MVGKLVMITVGILWAKRNNNFCNLYPISCPIISIFINDIMQVGRRTNAQGSKWVGVFSANYLFPLQGCLIFKSASLRISHLASRNILQYDF